VLYGPKDVEPSTAGGSRPAHGSVCSLARAAAEAGKNIVALWRAEIAVTRVAHARVRRKGCSTQDLPGLEPGPRIVAIEMRGESRVGVTRCVGSSFRTDELRSRVERLLVRYLRPRAVRSARVRRSRLPVQDPWAWHPVVRPRGVSPSRWPSAARMQYWRPFAAVRQLSLRTFRAMLECRDRTTTDTSRGQMPMHWRRCCNAAVTNHVCSRNSRDSAAHARRGSSPAASAKRYAGSWQALLRTDTGWQPETIL